MKKLQIATNTKAWFKAAGIRALKTIAQAAVAGIGAAAVMQDVDWVKVASTAVLAGILSLLTSICGIPEVNKIEDKADLEESNDQ